MAGGLRSPLLDMLGVRFLMLDAAMPPDRADARSATFDRTEVYRDEYVVIVENENAYDRAWIVHDVRPNNDGEGLAALAAGAVDGRQVAFVDGQIPRLSVVGRSPDEPAPDASQRADVTMWSLDQLAIRVNPQSHGLLVVSEIYESGWRAYVDGRPVDILRTNHALRGVAVGPGDEMVEFRYESPELTWGLAITAVAFTVVAASFGAAAWREVRSWRRPVPKRPADGASLSRTGRASH